MPIFQAAPRAAGTPTGGAFLLSGGFALAVSDELAAARDHEI